MTTSILHLDSSLQSENGESSRLSAAFIRHWQAREAQVQVVHRDLARTPVPHLTAARFGAFLTPPADRSPEQQAEVAESDGLIAELKAADVIVLSLPMYNFGVPSTLKAYFDHIARAGITFRYTASGPVGLLTARKAYVFATRGGIYAGTPRDTAGPYVRDFLQFLGVPEVEFVHAEGLAISPQHKTEALEAAHAKLPVAVAAAVPAQVEYAVA